MQPFILFVEIYLNQVLVLSAVYDLPSDSPRISNRLSWQTTLT